jgi:hypothetical protein
MNNTITKATAYDIWVAYDEIEKGEKLLAEVQEQLRHSGTLNLRDAFGRARNLQLGIPSGENAHRLLDVNANLAIPVIRAHINEKRSILEALQESVRLSFVTGSEVVA